MTKTTREEIENGRLVSFHASFRVIKCFPPDSICGDLQ